jgi:hypothetical protein
MLKNPPIDENTKNNVKKCPPIKDTKRKIIQKKSEVACHDPSFGFTTKRKAWKGAGRECNPRVTFTFLKMQNNVRE